MGRRVAILGGGISGLSAAFNLARCTTPVEVTVYEASSKVGGWMESTTTAGGGLFELGPRSLRTAGASARVAMEMISSVGMEEEVIPITKSHKAAHRRLIYTDAHGLIEVPSNLSWVVKTKPPFSQPLIGTIVKELFTKKGLPGDESIQNFITRRFGHEVMRYLVDPMCRGVYASSARSLSIQSCFPTISQAEQTHGSVIRGMVRTRSDPIPPDACSLLKRCSSEKWTLYTLKEGLGSLPLAMHRYLLEKGVQVHLGMACSRLDFRADKVVVEAGGRSEYYDHVVSTIPSYAMSSLLRDSHSPLAEKLDTIASVTVGVVCLEYEGTVLPEDYREAFGYLVPSTESSRILGVVFDSSTFPEHNRKDKPSTRLTVMLGGEWFEDLFGNPDEVSDEFIIGVAQEELRLHLGITSHPTSVLGKIHKNCIPKYEIGHSSKLDFVSNYLSQKKLPLTLTGSFYRGVSINDCIYNSILSTSDTIVKQ